MNKNMNKGKIQILGKNNSKKATSNKIVNDNCQGLQRFCNCIYKTNTLIINFNSRIYNES